MPGLPTPTLSEMMHESVLDAYGGPSIYRARGSTGMDKYGYHGPPGRFFSMIRDRGDRRLD